MEHVMRTAIGLVVLGALFAILQRCWPAVRGQGLRRAGLGTDLLFWFATPLLFAPATMVVTAIVLLPLLRLLGIPVGEGYLGHGPIAQQPTWLQTVEMLVLGDLIGYWTHRWFHTGPLWRFHAVHHSSTALDWLSSTRLHPVNEILSRLLSALPLLLLGFAPGLLAAYVPFLTLYALLLHANVRWDFGPLRVVLASPAFHRWHHASEAAAVNRNFAGLLPLWDLLFGTLYMPSRQPTEFGVHDVRLPRSFAGLVLFPFRRAAAPATVRG